MEPTKRIKILTTGHIGVLGGIYGPILTPYNEKESIIFKLVAAGIKVVEVLENGKEVAISVSNFKTDNSKPAKNANKEEEKKEVENVEEDKVEAETVDVPAKEDTVEDSTVARFINDEEEPVEEDKVEAETVDAPVVAHTNNNQNYNKHNKNNKKR